MRHAIKTFAILIFIGTAAPSLAADYPDLVGRWTIKSEGMSIAAGGGSPAEPVSVDSVFVIDKQDGFRISGKEMSQRIDGPKVVSDQEHFAGIIGVDNKTVSMIDENGFRDCNIVTPDRMECIYRHVASPNSVVTRNTWTKLPD